jgi:hypothetical protein
MGKQQGRINQHPKLQHRRKYRNSEKYLFKRQQKQLATDERHVVINI